MAAQVNNCFDGIRSARCKTADPRLPMTKPICTDMVNQACPEGLNCQASVKAGTTAEAENQTVITSNSARASKKMVCHFPRFEWSVDVTFFRRK